MGRISSIAREERLYPAARPRTPEPMAMDEPQSVRQFHAGGATASSMRAVYELSARALDALLPRGGRLLDLGVGSGRGLGRLLARRPDLRATGVDLAPTMLTAARRFLDGEGLGGRASLVEADLTALPGEVSGQSWDAISSVWALHHLPERRALRAALRQIAALRERGGGAIWLLDFQRLRDPASLRALLAVLQPDMPPVLRADTLASEAAAFTHDELRAELGAAGLRGLDAGLVRPVPWLQAFWSRGRDAPPCGKKPRRADDADLLTQSFSDLPF